jgi:hypothetical protein
MLHASIAEDTRKTECSKERKKENPTKVFIFFPSHSTRRRRKMMPKMGLCFITKI